MRRLAQRTADSNGQADLLANTWGLGDRDAGLLDANLQQMLAATPAEISAATRRWLDHAVHIMDLEPAAQYRRTSANVDRSQIPLGILVLGGLRLFSQTARLREGHRPWRNPTIPVLLGPESVRH